MTDAQNRITSRPGAPSWEKRGNTAWVSCRSCEGWLPVEEELIAEEAIDLKCPHCGDTFRPGAASAVIEP